MGSSEGTSSRVIWGPNSSRQIGAAAGAEGSRRYYLNEMLKGVYPQSDDSVQWSR